MSFARKSFGGGNAGGGRGGGGGVGGRGGGGGGGGRGGFNRNGGGGGGRGGGGGFNRNGGGGGGRGGGGGFNRNGGGGGGRGGGFSGRGNFDQGPPERVIPLGYFNYPCQDDLVCKVEIEDVPYFNAPIYLENKEQIGKIDEIFGSMKDYSVSVKLAENMNAKSFKANQKIFIDPTKLLPLSRFILKPLQPKGARKKMPGGEKKGGFSGRGGGFSGRGGGGRPNFNKSGGGGGFRGGNRGGGRGGGGGGGGGGGFKKGGGGRGRW